MRLHRLEMTAFGPFAETAAVDFDELGADGLFLLHGQTGAGKTTVLDAIAYALYGRVPGARGDKRLHSDHAAAHIRPEVVLEATLGGRRIRLTRQPEFERPKLRGSGTRVEHAKATLAWLDGQGTNLSRINEIGDEIVRLLGMSADQFFQVVLLPQGDFAKFLRAENEDRERLLEKLFDTGRFGSAEQWLTAQRKASGEQIGTQQRNVEDLITRVAVTAGIDRTERIDILDAVEWSQDLLTAARGDLETAQRELDSRRAESARADERAERERRAAEQRRRLESAQEQLARYTADAEVRAADRGELDRARRAEPVAGALAEAETAVRAARDREAESLAAAERLARLAAEPDSVDIPGIHLVSSLSEEDPDDRPGPAAARVADEEIRKLPVGSTGQDEFALFDVAVEGPPREGFDPGADEPDPVDDRAGYDEDLGLDTAIRGWSAVLGKLDEIRADAATADTLRDELAGLHTTAKDLGERSAELTDHRARLPAIIAGAQARAREADDAKAALPGLRAERKRLQEAATAAVELARSRSALDRLRVDLDTARARHLTAREHVLDLRERRLAGMAAELAGNLVDGQACAVCGSAEHPHPARLAAGAVSKEDETAAVATERTAEASRDRAQTALTEVEREIEALLARGGDTDRVELAAALREATERCGDAEELAESAVACTAEVARLRTDETRLHDALRDAETRAGSVAARIQAVEARLTEIEGKLRTAAGRDGTIGRRRERLHMLIAAAGDRRDTYAAVRTGWERVAGCVVRVERLAISAGLVPPTSSTDADPDAGAGGPSDEGHESDSTSAEVLETLRVYSPLIGAATRTPQRQDALNSALAAADEIRAAAQAVLDEPEIRAAAAAAPGDPEALAAAVRTARIALDEAVAAHSAAVHRVTQLETLCGQLWAAVDLIAPAQRAHQELAELAEVVAGRGENNRRMSLRSYVLAARLEEVAVAGSARLRRMSGGRYEFVHTDRAGTHGRRGGLGLDIRDDYTGAVRPARTLSGGETFMASLALALGLADTVAAEAGGIILDTLFIDEGFGSLDADTLDAVMGVLDELRAGGRVVGLVSHVDEMRQRIPSRLHVVRGRNGSQLHATIA
ncbi:AAA family ATPase [Nocardia jinanensis]|uniref:Nuclease SbcCD subunit C n=1 Tax=Nocardia jinanensis TaxID=382504 RepID=A0A917VW87_9NOCA|nr:AAA family ATPase [Nocardia jinanensis]GGL30254.1 nuclease SbcCD subunit C [Nocardia jinanensis]